MSSEKILLKIYNGQAVTPTGILNNATVLVRSGIIESVAEGNLGAPGAIEIDAKGQFIAPGLIDIQVNGYNSVSFCFEGASKISEEFKATTLTVSDVKKATEGLWEEGVTTYFPTLTTNSQEVLKKNFGILAKAMEDPSFLGSIPGFHLEGPYISEVDGYRGAHPLEHVRKPVWSEFLELYKASGEKIILITVAPEVEGAYDFIRKCRELGIVVSLGHHNGTAGQIKQAIDNGAGLATHLGNGCAGTINRHHNPIWPQLADGRLRISFIADGFHLPPEMLQVFYKTKGVDNIVITSDITSYAGLPAGIYKIKDGKTVEKTADGNLLFSEGGLYGSASPLRNGVAHIMKVSGCGLVNAIRMTTLNPAFVHNLDDRGVLEKGKRADLILFTMENEKMIILKTIVAGKEVYSKD
ncbi:MAG: amidohydrolase family protein [Prolixibacteraceae bacterium]|jgi:N-acetylglucosamine-6-phosphate deacetylase|nr:amidohydrolase family protein [Prolixibacteraceae bacterium]